MNPVIHLIGLPTDQNSSFERGAALAPPAIRAALWSDRGNLFAQSGQEIGTDITLKDLGDLPLSDVDCAADDALIIQAVTEAVDEGAIPLFLGGDHAVTYPIVAALAARHGALNILHFDAHPDIYADFEGNPRSHASPFARILEAGHASRIVQVGIRTLNRHCQEQAERYNVEILPMLDFRVAGVPVLHGPLYISIDLDGIDPSEAPGVVHPEPGGLTVREVLSILARQTAHIVGADIVELNPARDVNDVTAIVAAKLVRELSACIHRNNNHQRKERP
ncbi:agmatinase [Sphingorhabdus sp.]|uniref:agmatinase n=1 Tax=Sphingorhabdus sp. TaxID=1902408 RepID=UPI00391AF013